MGKSEKENWNQYYACEIWVSSEAGAGVKFTTNIT